MLYKSGSHSHKAAQDQKPSHLPLFPTAKLAREMRTASTHKQRPLCLKKIKLAFRLDLPFLSISSFQSSGQAWLAAHSCGSSSFLLDLAIQEKVNRKNETVTNQYESKQTTMPAPKHLAIVFVNLFFENPVRKNQGVATDCPHLFIATTIRQTRNT